MAFLHGIEVVQIDDGIRPIQTVRSSVIGLIGTAPDADAATFPLNQPVIVFGPRQAADLGGTGTLGDAYAGVYAQGVNLAIVVRVEEGVDKAASQANIVGDAVAMTGVHAFVAAETTLGLTPRILAAPGFTDDRPGAGANPVVAALEPIASRLRSIVIADGPNTTFADAQTYAGDWGAAGRVYIVDPALTVFDTATAQNVTRPASAHVAGRISRTDQDKGFWWSPSNRALAGIVGTARPVGFALSDQLSEANLLNEQAVATVVRKSGFRLWGNRVPSTDPLWAFLSVRRTADMIYESIEAAHLWAMDRPMSAQLVSDIRDSVQAYLQDLVNRGALLGGRCWFDPELNTQTILQSGQLYLDFDIEPPAPLERLTFRAHRNGAYYRELALDVAATNPEA